MMQQPEGNDNGALRLNLHMRARYLIGLLTALGIGGGVAYQQFQGGDRSRPAITGEWKAGIDKHMQESLMGYRRLDAVEAEVNDLKDEVREMRRDQLDQWRWQARQAGADERAEELEMRLRKLERKPGLEKKR